MSDKKSPSGYVIKATNSIGLEMWFLPLASGSIGFSGRARMPRSFGPRAKRTPQSAPCRELLNTPDSTLRWNRSDDRQVNRRTIRESRRCVMAFVVKARAARAPFAG